MKKRILWTTAALLATAIGIPLSSYAESIDLVDSAAKQAIPTTTAQPSNVVKVGAYQSPTTNQSASIVARIQPHQVAGRQAATLYVKNIPVLTFLDNAAADNRNDSNVQTKVATDPNTSATTVAKNASANNTAVQRATKVAATLNQLHSHSVDASKITVQWKAGVSSGAATKAAQASRYAIKLNDNELVEINSVTRLPDQTTNLAEDALQATNRLRRLLGNAPPLREVSGMPAPPPTPTAARPKAPQRVAVGPIRLTLNGMASWYGPGFHGNRSASGERFNQNALTAAHRHLPFGTKVRVTNKRNGRSVIVRINDRGPFTGGRIIDLSAGAARVLGVMQSGVAPVKVEVLR